jgi:hypothetical protein
MARINVTDETGREVVGCFNDKAEGALRFSEGTRWNGNNHISLATGSQWDHEALHLTARRRHWVLNRWSQWQGSADIYTFICDTEAFAWLLANGRVDEAAKTLPADIALELAGHVERMEA